MGARRSKRYDVVVSMVKTMLEGPSDVTIRAARNLFNERDFSPSFFPSQINATRCPREISP